MKEVPTLGEQCCGSTASGQLPEQGPQGRNSHPHSQDTGVSWHIAILVLSLVRHPTTVETLASPPMPSELAHLDLRKGIRRGDVLTRRSAETSDRSDYHGVACLDSRYEVTRPTAILDILDVRGQAEILLLRTASSIREDYPNGVELRERTAQPRWVECARAARGDGFGVILISDVHDVDSDHIDRGIAHIHLSHAARYGIAQGIVSHTSIEMIDVGPG
jgi:hypothetical protein